MINHIHYFNFVKYTSWPFYICWSTFLFLFFFVSYLSLSGIIFFPLAILSFFFLLFFIDMWSLDIFIESNILGNYSKKIYAAVFFGFILFLLTECMVFSGFFWAYFDIHFNGNFSFFKGYSLFLYSGYENFVNLFIPFYGTVLLEYSAKCANVSFYYLKYGILDFALFYLLLIFLSGFFFLFIQYNEYDSLLYCINDDALTSCFYLLTGFHAFHVLVGLIVFFEFFEWFFSNPLSLFSSNESFFFSNNRMILYPAALSYWTFVDVVWFFLFCCVYVDGFSKLFLLSDNFYYLFYYL